MPARSARGHVWLLLSAAAALIVFALLWLGYAQQWNGLSRLDVGALTPAHHYGIAHPGWVTAWDVFATALGPGAFRIGGAIIIVVLLVRGQRRPAVFLLVTIELSALVTELAKLLAGRPRPATKLVDAYGTSFPSGTHSASWSVYWHYSRCSRRKWLPRGVPGSACWAAC